jgi:hypothetical protein
MCTAQLRRPITALCLTSLATALAAPGWAAAPAPQPPVSEADDWVESWESAALGAKGDGELFSADTGLWEVYLLSAEWLPFPHMEQAAEVTVVPGRDLLLHARADAGELPNTQTIFSHGSVHREIESLVLNNEIPLTPQTRIEGSWNCDVYFERPRKADQLEFAYAEMDIRSCGHRVRYKHSASVTPRDEPLINDDSIVVGNQFDRNLYDDLVSLHGSSFIAQYELYQQLPHMRLVSNINLETAAAALPYPGGAGVADCTCHIGWLRFTSPSTCVTGRVLDPEGVPAPDVEVRARYLESTEPIASATTDTDGTYCLSVPPNSTILLYAEGQVGDRECHTEHPLYVDTQADEASCDQGPCQPVEDLVLTCAHTACIKGRVVNPDGEPIAGAEVTASSVATGELLASDFSGLDGSYCLDVPTNTPIRLEASKQHGGEKHWAEYPLIITTQRLPAQCPDGACQQVDDLIIDLDTGGGIVVVPSTGDFLGWTDGSDRDHYFTLVHIDGTTGAVTSRGGFGAFNGLCYDRVGNLYGVASGVSLIDPSTGEYTELFKFEYDGQSDIPMFEATIAADGRLYVHDALGRVFTVDLSSGAMTYIGAKDSPWMGLAFGPDERLYGAYARLVVIDPSDGGTTSELGNWFNVYISDLSSWPTGTLFGMDNFPSTAIWDIDLTSGQLTTHVTLQSPGITCFVPEYSRSEEGTGSEQHISEDLLQETTCGACGAGAPAAMIMGLCAIGLGKLRYCRKDWPRSRDR